MKNRMIPPEAWQSFFEDFNRRHRERLVNVAVVGEKIGAQREARRLPLNGLVADSPGEAISILLGGAQGTTIDHPVEEPVEVWVEMDETGAELAIEILSRNGNKTILEFWPPAAGKTAGA